MDEGIKRIFRRHLKRILNGEVAFDYSSFTHELTLMYASIQGLTEETAAKELFDGIMDNENDDG